MGWTTGPKVLVNCSGNSEVVNLVKGLEVFPADLVLVVRDRGRSYVVARLPGSLTMPDLPTIGTVTATPGSGQVTISTTTLGTITMPHVASYTPAIGNRVAIMWNNARQGIIVGSMAATAFYTEASTVIPATPQDTALPPPPPTQPVIGVSIISALDSASFELGVRKTANTVEQSSSLSGAWYYGTGPSDVLSGATVAVAEIYLARTAVGGSASVGVNLFQHSRVIRSSSDTIPPFFGVAQVVSMSASQEGWYVIPSAWAQTIIDVGGGIGIKNLPYAQLAGPINTPQSGSLRINWTR